MKKKTSKTTAAKPVAKLTAKRGKGYGQLVTAISAINTQMVTRVATVANQALVLRNWLVGAYIVEFEQNGADRAKYGARLLETLAGDLKEKGIKGLGARTLWNCKAFYALYPQIRQPAVGELGGADLAPKILQTVVAESQAETAAGNSATGGCRIGQPVVDPSKLKPKPDSGAADSGIRGSLTPESPTPLEPTQLARIPWAHFLEFIRIEDPWKRAFYENECLKGHWSKRQLQRQIESLLYERTGLSTNKKAVVERARKQELQESIADVLRDPYILEFTGLAERPEYSEDELESALLDHLQRF